MATYTKSLARRASLAESSAKAEKAYKAKVASLTSEKAELQARIQSLIEDVVKHKSNLKHTPTAKARAEDREKKAIEDLRVVKDELRVVKEEFQVVKEELCTKSAALDRARREASEAESSVERLVEECNALRGDLQRQEAMVSQRDGVIAKLRDEACTLWASGWLTFRRRAAKAFSGLDFNFQVPNENEAEEFVSEDEENPGCSLMPPALFLFLVKMRFLPRLALPSRLLGLRLLTCTAWRLALPTLLVALPQTFRPLCIIFAHFG